VYLSVRGKPENGHAKDALREQLPYLRSSF